MGSLEGWKRAAPVQPVRLKVAARTGGVINFPKLVIARAIQSEGSEWLALFGMVLEEQLKVIYLVSS